MYTLQIQHMKAKTKRLLSQCSLLNDDAQL
jgi:hypothetical protein